MLKIFYEIYNYNVNIHTKQDCKAFQSHMMPKWDMMTKLTEDYSMVEVTKVLAKQEGPSVCWIARFLHIFFLVQIQEKACKNQASQQMFGPSYFGRDLVYLC